MSSGCSLIYVTTATAADALSLGRTLVGERLIACANVIPAIASVYWWEGAVEEGGEAAMVAKTRDDLVEAVIARVRALHAYRTPCVVAVPIAAGNPDFLNWIAAETMPVENRS